MKVLIAGGGTGGHIYPAIAIADAIKEYDQNAELLFIATKNGMEKRLVEKAGYPTYHIEMSGLQRNLSLKNFKTLRCFITAPIEAKKLIKSFSPDLAVGTGGYLCWPLLHSAAKMGIPTAVHESNAIPGVAVKMLEGEVDSILLNFESVKDCLKHPEKALCVGNPTVSENRLPSRTEARANLSVAEKYVLLSFGGSLGSDKINSAALTLMCEFSSKHPEVLHVHSAGNGRYEKFMREFKFLGLDKFKNLRPVPYLYDMPAWEAAADAVICRAGAMTVSEMALYGKACVFIPSPNVAENHQFHNAARLSEKDAAYVIEEKNLTANLLASDTESLLFSEKGSEFSKNIKAFANPDAKKEILGELLRIVRKRNS